MENEDRKKLDETDPLRIIEDTTLDRKIVKNGEKFEVAFKREQRPFPKPLIIAAVISIAFVLIATFILMQPRTTTSPENDQQWKTLDVAGQEDFDKGKLVDAQKKFEKGLQLATAAHDAKLETASMNELLDLATANKQEKERAQLAASIAKLQVTKKTALALLPEIDKALAKASSHSSDSVETISTLCENANDSVASLLKAGDFKNAKLLVLKTKELADTALPLDAPVKARCLHNLAGALQDEGDFKNAIVMFKQALELHSKISGTLSPMMARSYYELGRAYLYSNDVDLAEKNLHVALQMYRQLVGPQSNEVANCKVQLAQVYEQLGDSQRSTQEANSAISILENVQEPDGETVATAYSIVARVNQDFLACKQALAICERQTTKPYPLLCDILIKMGHLCASSSLDASQALLQRAQAITERFADERKIPLDANLCYARGRVLLLKGDLPAAKASFEEALIAGEKVYGKISSPVSQTLTNLALCYEQSGNAKLAEETFKKASEVLKKCHRKQYQYTEATLFLTNEYSRWLDKNGRKPEAAALRKTIDTTQSN